MRKRTGVSLAALTLSTIGLSAAYAQDSTSTTKDSYFFSQAYYVVQDNERAIFDDDGAGFRMGFGRQIQNHWYWEANVAYNVLETGIDGFTDYFQTHIGVDAVYRFGKKDGARPFLLLGLGAVHDDVFPLGTRFQDDETSFFSNVGFGITSSELFNIGLKVRADARYVISEFEDGYEDGHFSLGFEIPLGRKTQVVTKTVVKEVVREVPMAPVDSDGDGVYDSLDRCANTLRGTKVDQRGCALKEQTVRLEGVNFQSGRDQLTGESVEVLTDVARFLKNQPDLRLEISGHTDAIGSAILNKQLSQKRADAVKYFLVRAGVDAGRMRAVGYGETEPVASNAVAEGRAKNRRVEFRIWK